jgi:hypothetical protein
MNERMNYGRGGVLRRGEERRGQETVMCYIGVKIDRLRKEKG